MSLVNVNVGSLKQISYGLMNSTWSWPRHGYNPEMNLRWKIKDRVVLVLKVTLF